MRVLLFDARYLIVQLKRFYYEQRGAVFLSQKIHTAVRYPVGRLVFDAAVPTRMRGDFQCKRKYQLDAEGSPDGDDPEVADDATDAADSAAAPVAAPAVEYRLCGVVNHFGSAHGGHYTATVRHSTPGGADDSGRWYNCNDATTAKVSAQAARSANAYILFYERVSPPQRVENVGSDTNSAAAAARAVATTTSTTIPPPESIAEQQLREETRQDAEAVAVAAELVAAVVQHDDDDAADTNRGNDAE